MSRHHTASPGKYPDRSEARPARTWSGTTPGKPTIRHGVTVHPRGLGKPSHRVSKRRDFWNYRAGVMSGPPNGPDITPPEEKRESRAKERRVEPTSTHAGYFAPEASGRDGRRSALEYHPCGYGFSRHAAAVMIAATRQALDAARLMAAITADAGVRHRLSASHRNGGTLQPAETEATRAAHNVGPRPPASYAKDPPTPPRYSAPASAYRNTPAPRTHRC